VTVLERAERVLDLHRVSPYVAARKRPWLRVPPFARWR
jgi:hypothetical protein